MATNWFNKPKPPPSSGHAIPPTDDPNVEPRALPAMSEARQIAIAKAVAEGRASGVLHALFLWRAGLLDLPV